MPLTKADAENLYHVTGEIQDLEREIQKAEKKLHDLSGRDRNVYTADTYRDYSHNANGSIKIVRGYGYSENDFKKQREYFEEIRVKRNRLIDRKMILEKELDKIDDVIIRRIIRLKFFDRFSWEDVAIAIDPTKSGEAMRKRLERYFREAG